MLDGFSPLPTSIALADAYRAAGGVGPVVLSRRVWLGDAPSVVAQEDLARYRDFTDNDRHDRMQAGDSMLADHDPERLAQRLHEARLATDAYCLSLRMNLPGMDPAAVRDQIERLGEEVLPTLRSLSPPTAPSHIHGC